MSPFSLKTSDMKTIQLTEKRIRGEFYASDSMYKEAFEKFGNEQVLNFAYTNYGGSFIDKVLIEFYKENHQDKIVSENTSWNGQNAICLPIEGMESNDFFYSVEGLEEYYSDMKGKMIEQEINSMIQSGEYTENEVHAIEDFLGGYANIEPNFLDCCDDDLRKYVSDNKNAA